MGVRGLPVLLVLSVILGLSETDSIAQVVIEETIRIATGDSFAKSLATGDTLHVSFDGVLVVEYTSALATPMEDDAILHIGINGTPFHDDSVAHRVDSVAQNTFYCSDYGGMLFDRYTYYFVPDSAFPVGPVVEGDKIIFDYDGKKTGSYFTQNAGGSTWIAYMGTEGEPSACESPYKPLEWVTFTATLVPDTLSIKFDPPADSDVYPEPGLEIEVTAIVTDAENSGHVRFEIENFDYPDTEYPDTLIYFLDGADTTLTLDPVGVVDDTARATLIAKDTWGQVKVTATYLPEVVGKLQAGPTTTPVKTKIWPEDDDLDGISDRWEKEDCGTLNLSSVREDIGCEELNSLTGGTGDWCWDMERSQGINDKLDGDGLTKLQEYQGLDIGSTIHRLDCNRKEVFVDISQAAANGGDVQAAAEWAVQTLGSELDIETFYSNSISGINIDGNTTRFPGTNRLRWSGANSEKAPLKGYIRVSALPSLHPQPVVDEREEWENALVVDYDTNYFTSAPVLNDNHCLVKKNIGRKACQPIQSMGGAHFAHTYYRWEQDSAYSTVEVFTETIANLYDVAVNNVTEAVANHTFRYATAVPRRRSFGRPDRGTVFFRAFFDDFDVDQSGGKDAANPFDLLSDPALGYEPQLAYNDDSTPGQITGLTELEFLKRVLLHELGHAVGMWNKEPYHGGSLCSVWRGANAAFVDYHAAEQEECHHMFEESVMRSGFGPARLSSFSLLDKASIMIRRPQ